jgi:hypothetical protein
MPPRLHRLRLPHLLPMIRLLSLHRRLRQRLVNQHRHPCPLRHLRRQPTIRSPSLLLVNQLPRRCLLRLPHPLLTIHLPSLPRHLHLRLVNQPRHRRLLRLPHPLLTIHLLSLHRRLRLQPANQLPRRCPRRQPTIRSPS